MTTEQQLILVNLLIPDFAKRLEQCVLESDRLTDREKKHYCSPINSWKNSRRDRARVSSHTGKDTTNRSKSDTKITLLRTNKNLTRVLSRNDVG